MRITERDFPSCPICQKGIGIPVSNSTGHWEKTITYRCPSCAYEWNVTSQSSPTVLFALRGDR